MGLAGGRRYQGWGDGAVWQRFQPVLVVMSGRASRLLPPCAHLPLPVWLASSALLAPLQARLQLAAYQAMGPTYARLAAEHAAVLEALEGARYELAEVEQFRALAAVTG